MARFLSHINYVQVCILVRHVPQVISLNSSLFHSSLNVEYYIDSSLILGAIADSKDRYMMNFFFTAH